MMTAAQSLAEIARLLEAAMADDTDPETACGLLIQAHTHAVIQASQQRRVEARTLFAAFPDLDQATPQ